MAPDPFLHCMPCIDLAMPPDHNMVLNEAVEVPSWMSTSFGQDLGCSLSYVDKLPVNRKKAKKAMPPRESRREGAQSGGAGDGPCTTVEEWTKTEDGLLVSAVQQFGDNWALVAFALNKCPSLRGRIRSGSQCCARHSNLLALGGVHRLLPRPARPLTVRLPEEFL
ncbi:unnamed protein product, partial [Laminaria digitata]